MYVFKEVQRRTARLTEKGEYECDVTIDRTWYENRDTGTLLETIKQKVPWLQEEDAIMQQDDASRHTGHDVPSNLTQPAVKGGWNIKIVMQRARSPDLSVNELGFFASLKSRV